MHSHDRTLLTQLGFQDKDKRDPRHDLACRYLTRPNIAPKLLDLFPDQKQKGYEWQVESTKLEVHLAKGEGKFRSTIGFVDGVIHFSYLANKPCPLSSLLRASRIDEIFQTKIEYTTFREEIELVKPFDTRVLETVSFWLTPKNSTPTGIAWDSKDLVWGGHNKSTESPHEKFTQLVKENEQEIFTALKAHPHRRLGAPLPDGRGILDEGAKIALEVKINPVAVGDILRQIELYREYFASRPEPVWVLAVAFDMTDGDKRSLEHHGIQVVKLGAKFEEFVASQDEKPADLTEV